MNKYIVIFQHNQRSSLQDEMNKFMGQHKIHDVNVWSTIHHWCASIVYSYPSNMDERQTLRRENEYLKNKVDELIDELNKVNI